MQFRETWQRLLKSVDALPSDATLVTPVSSRSFRVADIQDRQLLIAYQDDSGETGSLRRSQFKTLCENVADATDGFSIDRLPPNGEAYAVVLSLHPHFEYDMRESCLNKTETQSDSPFVEVQPNDESKGTQQNNSEVSVGEMLDNMGDPEDEVECPIDGCDYSHRSASSVARHVSGSSTDRHIWANTSYPGWRDFVRKHGESPS